MRDRTKVVNGQLKVSDVMSHEMLTVSLGTSLLQVAKLLDGNRSRFLLVTDEDGALVGMVSDSDLVRYIADGESNDTLALDSKTVECLMATKFITSSPDANAEDVATALCDGSISCMHILEDGRLVGVMAGDDLLLSCSRLDPLLKQASFDPLTGLLNRASFDRRLEEELERAYRQRIALALILIDVDRFKSINDVCGHVTGDTILRVIGGCLLRHLRKYDVVARIGGDEFAAICTVSEKGEVRVPLLRLQQAIRSLSVPSKTGPCHVSLSIGCVVLHPRGKITATELLEAADQCLYQAKAQGRDRVCSAHIGEDKSPKPYLFRPETAGPLPPLTA
ncbi:MAG: GGDEF domain-containing protein [Planctomycetes bacterium]|nr:GGDEF domain-containing protein [Planctomycetota bacterium]